MILKRKRISVSMNWNEDFAKDVDQTAERLGISRTRLIEAIFQGLSSSEIEAVVKRGEAVIAAKRKDYLATRRLLSEKLDSLSPTELEAILLKAVS